VNGQGYLGIYIAKDRAAVVCLDSVQAPLQSVACFEVWAQPQTDPSVGFAALADQIAQTCSRRNLQFSHVAVALDCSLYMQHHLHSTFSDSKQIESTVRFDTEEALATDISDIALAFSILSSDQGKSMLRVFSSQKRILAEIINALAANNLDPATVEPDVVCLSRFIANRCLKPQEQSANILFAALSQCSGYLTGPFGADDEKVPVQRTFLVAPGQDRNSLILRQLSLSLAQLTQADVNKVILLDSAGLLRTDQVGSALALSAQLADFTPPQDCGDPVAFAAACGAAMSSLQKEPHLSFRSDYMPHLGKRRRLEKTLRIVSISACVILAAVGLNLTVKLIQKNKPVKLLYKKFALDYGAVLPDRRMPPKLTKARDDLKREVSRIKNVRSGQVSATGEKSVPAKLTAVLEAFNAVASRTNLNIEKISIGDKNIAISGDTSSRSSTLELLTEIKKTMNVQQTNLGTKGGRDTFSFTAVLKTGG